MGLGVGIFLAAVGAVLAFAVTDTVSGVNIHTVGWILLIVGIVGIVLSMIFWSSWAGPGYFDEPPPHDDVDDGPPALPATRPSRNESVHRRGAAAEAAPSSFQLEATGSSTVNVEPRRPSEATQMRPCIRCTSSRQM